MFALRESVVDIGRTEINAFLFIIIIIVVVIIIIIIVIIIIIIIIIITESESFWLAHTIKRLESHLRAAKTVNT